MSTNALARHCAGFGADLLALQEVDVRSVRSWWADQAGAVGRRAGLVHAFAPARSMGSYGLYGNALLARGALEDVEVLGLPRTGRSEPRVALLATAVAAGRSLSVAATHLSTARSESLEQLDAVLASLLGRPPPLVLLGDLNLEPPDVRPRVEAAGLVLADSAAPTYPAHAPRLRIDHVALAGAAARAVEVVPAGPVSDHRAVMVDAVVPR